MLCAQRVSTQSFFEPGRLALAVTTFVRPDGKTTEEAMEVTASISVNDTHWVDPSPCKEL